ncbi:sigma-54-dependent transcriptional regulator [Anaeromyxobacter dehalogenans]|uniref:Two component, sigma54 specific, transcriptional regulator, Fis family n=1 Tax=Anaeromyxobacter dehalogenans (strain 2CP-C) TaxID=290397 RepID=Q2IJD6_ANADE|nr:sigma-54 dependent transcriptional regulator [Anaeromyxobacter dehalogenans]ABC81762.1 two component, sigma54 specific, transcriptional regulator, Fis family [Anaeromyxobacter dehalogenans 2CP-C]
MNSTPARILVVDDEKLIRWSVAERLQRGGYEVLSAESGEQALEMVAATPPDVMLLDVRLPGIDGVQTLQRALSLHPEVAVLMMSAHSTVDIAVEAMKHGAIDFLVKPFPFQQLDEAVERALANARTRRQIATLTSDKRGASAVEAVVGSSAAMEQVRSMISRLAGSDTTTVLIEGESGSGKEVVARAIHFRSARADKPILQVNCAALPEHLLESELFGHERGAFTDAHTQKRGLFETAEGGSVMLDEIGDLPPGGQAKLLRMLENKTFRRVGGVQELRADVRVIAATNVNLEERVAEGRFRADLFFRLNVVRIVVPPLREHLDDVPTLTAHFVARFDQEMKRQVKGVAPAAMELLKAYHWPGNVRELRNVIERAFILHAGADEIRPEHLPPELRKATPGPRRPEKLVPPVTGEGLVLDDVERKLIAEAMERASGNQSKAARLLGVSRDTLRYRLKKHGMA